MENSLCMAPAATASVAPPLEGNWYSWQAWWVSNQPEFHNEKLILAGNRNSRTVNPLKRASEFGREASTTAHLKYGARYTPLTNTFHPEEGVPRSIEFRENYRTVCNKMLGGHVNRTLGGKLRRPRALTHRDASWDLAWRCLLKISSVSMTMAA